MHESHYSLFRKKSQLQFFFLSDKKKVATLFGNKLKIFWNFYLKYDHNICMPVDWYLNILNKKVLQIVKLKLPFFKKNKIFWL